MMGTRQKRKNTRNETKNVYIVQKKGKNSVVAFVSDLGMNNNNNNKKLK